MSEDKEPLLDAPCLVRQLDKIANDPAFAPLRQSQFDKSLLITDKETATLDVECKLAPFVAEMDPAILPDSSETTKARQAWAMMDEGRFMEMAMDQKIPLPREHHLYHLNDENQRNWFRYAYDADCYGQLLHDCMNAFPDLSGWYEALCSLNLMAADSGYLFSQTFSQAVSSVRPRTKPRSLEKMTLPLLTFCISEYAMEKKMPIGGDLDRFFEEVSAVYNMRVEDGRIDARLEQQDRNLEKRLGKLPYAAYIAPEKNPLEEYLWQKAEKSLRRLARGIVQETIEHIPRPAVYTLEIEQGEMFARRRLWWQDLVMQNLKEPRKGMER